MAVAADRGVAEVVADFELVLAAVDFGAAEVAHFVEAAGAAASAAVTEGAIEVDTAAVAVEATSGTDVTVMGVDIGAATALALASATRPGIGPVTLMDIPTITDIPTTITETRAITDTTHMPTVDSPLIHRRLLIVP